MSLDDPDVLVGARKECPLVIGRGDGEQFIASAIPAFLAETRRVQIIENGEIVVVRPDGVAFMTPEGDPIDREVTDVDWDEETAEKSGYETFMLKEIHEQPDAVAETLADRAVREDGIDLADDIDENMLREAKRIVIVACGTSYHAGLVGRYAIEEWARLPVEMDIASEYRYRNPVVGPGDLVIGITQSGETADTLAAMRLAGERGAKVLAVTNVMGSQATRDANGVLYTRAGLEIGVAATKTFVCQVTVMYLLALRLGELRGTLDVERRRTLVADLKHIPHALSELLESVRDGVERIADRHSTDDFFLYLGRHVGLPIALEGALKLKEISYIATDAYAAGEMKHGPIALLDERTPVVTVATDSPVLEKVVSNMQEVRARGAHVIAVATEGNVAIGEHAEEVLRVPAHRLDAAAAAGDHPAAAAGLRDRPPPRAERGPAAQPGEDGHRRVRSASGPCVSAWICWRSSGSSRRWSAGPGSPIACSPTASARTRRAGPPGAAPRRAVLREGGGRQGAAPGGVELAGHRGHRARRGHRDHPARRARRPGDRRADQPDAHARHGGRGGGDRVSAPGGWVEPLFDAEEMRATDRWAIEERGIPSLALMERAGEGLAALVWEVAPSGPVAVVCGRGNNGGDGLVAARLMHLAGREVRVLLVGDPGELRGDAAENLRAPARSRRAVRPRAPGRRRGHRRRPARHGLHRRAARARGRGPGGDRRRRRPGGRRRRAQRRRRVDRRGRRCCGPRRRDGHVPRRQAGAVDQPGQGARGRRARGGHRHPARARRWSPSRG